MNPKYVLKRSELGDGGTRVTAIHPVTNEAIFTATFEGEGAYDRAIGYLSIVEGRTAENQLRRLLAIRHGCDLIQLYTDDGELSCGQCHVDFNRLSPHEIEQMWTRQGKKKYYEAQDHCAALLDSEVKDGEVLLRRSEESHPKARKLPWMQQAD